MKPSTFWVLALAPALFIADLPADKPLSGGVSLMNEAHAVVGRPLTPVSVAGVARRTTRRSIVATSVYVAALPPACTVVVIEGTSLHHCGTTYYQASGTQYVVVNVQ
jgi:hypothetical protein